MNITLPTFIENWKNAIETGKTPDQLAQLYHTQGVLKGTIWDKAVQGHEQIEQYFIAFTTGKNNAKVNFTTITKTPSGSYAGEYTFSWNDDTGTSASANANYTFEPSEDGLISLHHSSFLPSEQG